MFLKRTVPLLLLVTLFSLFLAACQDEEPTPSPDEVNPEQTADSSEDPIAAVPTLTPIPVNTPLATLPPTNTPAPSGTPAPTLPVRATLTREPSPTPSFFIETRVVASTLAAPTRAVTTTPAAQIPNPVNGSNQLITAANTLNQQNTFRVVETSTINDQSTSSAYRLGITQTCDVQRPSNLYCKNSYTLLLTSSSQSATTNNEFVKRGSDIWTRDSADDDWTKTTISAVEQDGFTIESIERFLVPPVVDSIQSVQTTVLNGVSVYRIEFTIDEEVVIERMLNDSLVVYSSTATLRGSGIAWIGVDDNLPRRAIINMDITENNKPINVVVQIDYSNFNQSVTIPDPNNP